MPKKRKTREQRNARKDAAHRRRPKKKGSRTRRASEKPRRTKAAKSRRTQPEWKLFQDLVARIEQLLAPNAQVKCPDHLPNLTTGDRQEVDASIRLTVGSTPILITIECRKRGRKEDVTWLQQVAAKRKMLGANQTICVSESGFSAPAQRVAVTEGLQLRRLRDITDNEIASWTTTLQLLDISGSIKVRAVEMDFLSALSEDDTRAVYEAGKGIVQGPEDTVVLHRVSDDLPIIRKEILSSIIEGCRRTPQLGNIDTGEELSFGVRFDRVTPYYYLLANNSKFFVCGIRLIGAVSSERTTIPLSRVLEYATTANVLVHVLQFEIAPRSIVEIHVPTQTVTHGQNV